jgi:hypothetical protein
LCITGQNHNNTPPPRKGKFALSCVGDDYTLTIKGSVSQTIKTIGAILATLLTVSGVGTMITSPYLEEARFKYLLLPQADPALIDRPTPFQAGKGAEVPNVPDVP